MTRADRRQRRFSLADAEFHFADLRGERQHPDRAAEHDPRAALEASFRLQAQVGGHAANTSVAIHQAVYDAIVAGDRQARRGAMESVLALASTEVRHVSDETAESALDGQLVSGRPSGGK